MTEIAKWAVTFFGWIFVAVGFWHVGREHERKKMREENGWWSGFRAGLEQQRRTIQAELLERGVVLTFNDPPRTKRN